MARQDPLANRPGQSPSGGPDGAYLGAEGVILANQPLLGDRGGVPGVVGRQGAPRAVADHILALAFGLEDEAVGMADEVLEGGAVPRVGRQPARNGEFALHLLADVAESAIAEELAETRGDVVDGGGVVAGGVARTGRLVEDDGELIAPDAAHAVVGADRGVQESDRLAEDVVSGLVAVGVVVALEVVDIEEEDRDRPAQRRRVLEERVRESFEVATILRTGQGVGVGLVAELGELGAGREPERERVRLAVERLGDTSGADEPAVLVFRGCDGGAVLSRLAIWQLGRIGCTNEPKRAGAEFGADVFEECGHRVPGVCEGLEDGGLARG